MTKLEERINESLRLIYDFIRDPFQKSISEVDEEKSLVFLASVLSGLIVIVRFLNTSMDNWGLLIYLIGGLLLSPLFGLLIVHFKGAIFNLYLKFIASPIFKVQLVNALYAKQIATFASIGLIVSAVPSLHYIGIVISLIIEILGLHRLYKLDLKNAIVIGILYQALWWGLLSFIAKDTAWI